MSLSILQLTEIKKSFGVKVVLDGVSFILNAGERAALVGENGVGKTTLARIIIGELEADSGTVKRPSEIGYLPQDFTPDLDMSIGDYIRQATGDLDKLQAEMRELETKMAENLAPDELDIVLERYGEVQDAFMRRGGYELEHRLEVVMTGLSIAYLDQDRLIGSLSGGEKTRVAMAALLLRSPDLLILDEPTNHLDFAAMEWLENYLLDYPYALLLISHDRAFINKVVTQIIEISYTTRQAQVYHGNYDDYIAEQKHIYESKVEAFESQREEMKRLRRLITMKSHNTGAGKPASDNDKFLKHFKRERSEGLVSKDIRDAKTRLERLEANPLKHPGRLWMVAFDFLPEPLTSQQAIRIDGLQMGFDDRILFSGLDAFVHKGDRIVIVAPNGTGKTTLLRLIMGLQAAQAGNIQIAPSAKLGYLDQEQETLNLDQDVLDSYREVAVGTQQDMLAELHRSGLFSSDIMDGKRTGDLSVGQRRKLSLAKLVASHANILLLDEPTNHLDLTALEALEESLRDFSGVVLAISHDRWFIEHVATQIWYLDTNGIRVEMVEAKDAVFS